MSTNKSTYLGKWYREKEKGGDFEEVEIIDFDGLRGYAKGNSGKTIPLNEFGSVWVRKEAIVADPFTANDLSSLKSADPTVKSNPELIQENELDEALAEETALLANSLQAKENTRQSAYIQNETPIVKAEEKFETAEESAIAGIIKASKEPSKITVSLEVEVPIDLSKLLSVTTALGFNNGVASGVVAKMTKLDNEKIKDIVSEAILKAMTTKK